MIRYFGETDDIEQVLFELSLVEQYWPQFSLQAYESRWLVHGILGGNQILQKKYEICIEIPSDYLLGKNPTVYILNENFPEGTPYVDRYQGKIDLPLSHDSHRSRRIMLHQIIALIAAWLITYETWKRDFKSMCMDSKDMDNSG